MTTCIPIDNQPTDVREITDGYGNASNPTLDDLIARGRRIYQPATQPGIIASHWEDDGRTMRQVVDEAKTQEQLDAEAIAQAEAEAQAAQSARLECFQPLIPVASLYRATLRRHFGDAAETNRDVTKAAVASYFETRRMAGAITALETADAVALLQYFDLLSAWNGTDDTWTLPWEVVP